MDQAKKANMLSIEVVLIDGTVMSFQVGKTWSLNYLRDQIHFYLSDNQDPRWSSCIVCPTGAKGDKR